MDMTKDPCPKCGHEGSRKEQFIVEGKLGSLGGIAVGSLVNHRMEITACAKCGYVKEMYHRGRVL
jgi:predicted nucleic-acid-binding Zn-ribbon protein